MLNIFIDTNIYIKLLSNLEESKLFEELKVLIKAKIVKLLVPEIIILELAKQNKTVKQNFQNEFNKLDSNVKEFSKSLWSEVRDIEGKISKLITVERLNKEMIWAENYNKLKDYLTSKNVEYIEFTPEIMCKGQKRIISGKLVRPYENSSQDAYNIESLINYFEQENNIEENEFIICSNDIKDFSRDKKEDDGFYKLHPILEDSFNNTKCVKSLEKLMKYINYGYEYINAKGIDTKNMDDLRVEKINIDDYSIERSKFEEIYRKNFINVFNKRIIYTQNQLKKYRDLIIKDIKKLLDECRSLEQWSDRSELKLYSWLENRSEEYIYISKLSDLILMRENLKKYYKIHLE